MPHSSNLEIAAVPECFLKAVRPQSAAVRIVWPWPDDLSGCSQPLEARFRSASTDSERGDSDGKYRPATQLQSTSVTDGQLAWRLLKCSRRRDFADRPQAALDAMSAR